jgi:hypothetical protein
MTLRGSSPLLPCAAGAGGDDHERDPPGSPGLHTPSRLAADGLIEPDREEARDGRLRRYCPLTRDGRGALAQEAELRAATAQTAMPAPPPHLR